MKMTFRWYGNDDPVTLKNIRQIPNMSGVVTAVYSVPAGEVWPEEDIQKLKEDVQGSGLEMEVIESVPVHEDIKLRRGNYQTYIDNYKEIIRRLSKYGVKCICYNFMPVFDWTRSQLDKELEDGSKTLVYYKEQVDQMDPTKLALPGWDASYTPAEMTELIDAYKALGEEGLWSNLEYFIKEIMPVAIECDINMAIHPDDPPWSIFNIPRIIKNENDLDRFLSLYDDTHHGLTLCSGSLGCGKFNNFANMVRKYGEMGRIHFAHIRNVKLLEDGSFEESAHYSPCGSLDIFEILKAYHDVGFKGYIRPDHGRMIWDETGKPGYGLYDRALGSTYITGIWEALTKMKGV
ncbi:mannonate dehydratase [Natranaerovirga pectinivora]|uniref:Mannonate dehydratase n=1 Tax=Natranaerovirga pectinivora TaxID=682400 RepID=A0A4R3MLE9_9FIRM|nr:mannonate dehydratase [Natranaerovirga pectinivora]TCT15526.1 mannonate dehydratase [Natranaerovirga pectinivora]